MKKKRVSLNQLETLDQYIKASHQESVVEEVALRPLKDHVELENERVIQELATLVKPTRLNLKHEVKLKLFNGEEMIGVPVSLDEKSLLFDSLRKQVTVPLSDIESCRILGIK
ncbi:hypothetical protein HMI01_19420 [Halolactibacillus miurensis]|uniref:YolD-like protein n=1 Tax=Halolactibacillus miurensis TaxID=306541 RepID=A0A1I6S2X6_9BACI|nr:hypothetical protein [Halolactibacillus miurensis]GEM04954.1 hypothetical protein HMI01_19420 [Halolactibacillus miurensis]SFS71230.1 hypothetical protein SAMN05421668_107102 [Halolactibacillus miurensis]